PGKALNLGIKAANGKYIVSLSGHCIPVNELWLSNLINNFNDYRVAGVYGRQEAMAFTSDSDKRKLAGRADIVTTLFNSMGYTFSYDDDANRFRWITNLLKPEGLYLLDIRAEDFQIKNYSTPQTTVNQFSVNLNNHEGDVEVETLRYWSNKILAVEKKIIFDGAKVQHSTYGWRTYSNNEIKDMLQNLDMRFVESRDDYYTAPENYGERTLFLFQKDKNLRKKI
ncbi:MAG: glycosyltransferase, partial [Patescibacteria group bacterium]